MVRTFLSLVALIALIGAQPPAAQRRPGQSAQGERSIGGEAAGCGHDQHQHRVGDRSRRAARHRCEDCAADRRIPPEERAVQEGRRAHERSRRRREKLPEAQSQISIAAAKADHHQPAAVTAHRSAGLRPADHSSGIQCDTDQNSAAGYSFIELASPWASSRRSAASPCHRLSVPSTRTARPARHAISPVGLQRARMEAVARSAEVGCVSATPARDTSLPRISTAIETAC